MKLVGLILVGLCAGFVSGTFYPLEYGRKPYCYQFSPANIRRYPPIIRHRIYQNCPFRADELIYPYRKLNEEENSKRVSTEIPSTTESANTLVLVTTEKSPEIRNPEFSNSFSSEEKIAKDTNRGTPGDFSSETTLSSLNTNSESTNPEISDDFSSEASKESGLITKIENPKTSNDASIEISKGTDGTTEITTPEVSDDSSLIQKSNAIANTTISDVFTKEISEATDETGKTTNSKAPEVHTSNETPEVTPDVANSLIPDNKEPTESSKLTERTLDVNDSSIPSTPVTTISRGTSDKTTHVTDILETSSVTAGISESTNSEISERTISSETTTDMQSYSTTPKNTVFISTEYTTSEKTNIDIDDKSSSTTDPSSSVRPDVLSTTGIYTTDGGTTENSTPRSQETTLDDTETTHSITVIELPGTRALKLGVSIAFLVIALIALVVLVGYFIITRRRTFSYDELLLLP